MLCTLVWRHLLGVDFDSNLSTTPFLHRLASAAKTRAALIHRLSYSMPPHVLSTFANGLLMGKVLSACPVTIPIRLNSDDNCCVGVTEEINKAIKSTARTITKTKLSDKVRSELVLQKAHLKCLNEAVASVTAVTVWKAKKFMNPLGKCLFQGQLNLKNTRSVSSNILKLPVPGYPRLATNLMAKVWNAIPELRMAQTLGSAKSVARKWARNIPR